MLRRLVLLVVVFALAGCVQQQRPMINAGQYRSVIVIAALPETLSYNYIGVTALQNEREVVPVNWGLSARALDHLAAALGKRYEVTKLPVDPMSLTGTRTESEMLKPDTYSNVSAALQRAVGNQSADLIVFMDAVTNLDAGDKARRWPRFGAYLGEQAIGMEAGTRVGVVAAYHVFDGRTFKLISTASTLDRVAFPLRTRGEPYARMPESLKEQIRDAVVSSLPAGIDRGLRQVGLVSN